MKTIGERLKEARDRKNLKQTQVMKHTGINNKTLSGYEKGVSEPDIDSLNLLANLYEVSVDWLTGREEQMKQQIIDLSGLDEIDVEVLREFKSLSHEDQMYVVGLMKRLPRKS